ncbi:DMT family transporter [Halolamina litorea]|uniref:DMT family transporter n=1 Tax=Halolamina litorea TaxID=1515593 RepID=A0ABD6BNG3_9EURY|nr:DMT family transporter [Halolamina litorea]
MLFVSLAWIWGGAFVAIEMGLGSVPPLWFAGLRYLLAGAVISAVAAATGRFRPNGRDEWLAVGVIATFVVAGYHGLLYLGTTLIPGSISSVIVSLSPVLTTVAAGLLLAEESPDLVDGLGLLFGVGGVVVIANPGGASVPLAGVGLVFVGVALFATGSVGLRALDSDLPPAALQGWAMLVGSTVLVVGAIARGEAFPTGVASGESALPFVYLVLGAGVIGYLAYFELLSRVGPVRVNLVAYLEPVTAAMGAWAVLGRAPTATTGAGFLLVFCGFALATADDPLARLRPDTSDDVIRSDLSEGGNVEVHYAD